MENKTIFLALGTDLETNEDLTCVLRLDHREVEFLLGRFTAFRSFAATSPYLTEACWDDDGLPEWKRGKLMTPAGSGLTLGPEDHAECSLALLDMARRSELEDVDLTITRGDKDLDALELYWAGIDPDTEEAVTTASLSENYLQSLLDQF
jgi:hypothetical protein